MIRARHSLLRKAGTRKRSPNFIRDFFGSFESLAARMMPLSGMSVSSLTLALSHDAPLMTHHR
jgi:hypothetical protein